MKHCYFVFILILSFTACYGQTDSLLLQGRKFAQSRNYTQAEVCFKKALLYDLSDIERAKINNNLGLLQQFKGSPNKSISYYREAISIYKENNKRELLAKTYTNLGVVYHKLGNNPLSLAYYNKAFSNTEKVKTKSVILNNIVRINSESNVNEAISSLKKILGEDPDYYLIKQNIARLYSKTNQLDSAVYYYRQAIKDQGYDYTPISLELYKEIGDLHYRNNDFESAWYEYHKAIEVFRYLQTIYIDDDTKLKSIEKHKDVFISAIESTVKLGEDESVIGYMEELKAPILEEKLTMNRLPDSLKVEYRENEHKISRCIKNDEYSKFDSLLKKKFEMLEGIEVKQRKNFWVILKSLPEDMAIVHYAYSDSLLTTCVIFEGETKITQSGIDKSFFSDIDTTIKNTFLYGNDTYQDYLNYMASLKSLYSTFEPNWPDNAKRIMIIPYSRLYQIPFEALTNSKPAEEWADFTNIDYAIDRFAFSYSPSIAALQYSDSNEVENAIAFIPNYSVDSLKLKHSLSEAESLKDYFDTDILQGEKANAENFFSTIGNYDIISVIAHGESEEIILDQDTIKAEELYKLNLNNCLTVLSTCNSNTGKLESTEGYFGTARKFLEVGSESVLATLWDIPDRSTKDIMSGFYKNLSDGDPKDIALQKAKVTYLNSQWSVHRSPAYWSGLVLMGNCAKIEQSNSNYMYAVLGIFGIILLLTLLVKYLRRSF